MIKDILRPFAIALLALLVTAPRATAAKTFPWDAVLIDVSGDVGYLDKSGLSVSDMILSAMRNLSEKAPASTIFMPYADSRAVLSAAAIKNISRSQLNELSTQLGTNTASLEAVASLTNLDLPVHRVLLLTNDIETGVGFTPRTLAEILGSKGITVDAVIFELQADSVRLPHYDVLYGTPLSTGKVTEFVNLTGGKILEINRPEKLASKLNKFIRTLSSEKAPKPSEASSFDSEIVGKCLRSLKTDFIKPEKVDTSMTVMYGNHLYHGLAEIRSAVRDSSGISGYVAEISEPYPEFDSYDASNEDRRYSNFIFALSAEELETKSNALRALKGDMNFCKLTPSTPRQLLPMVYYRGEGEEMIICGLEVIYDGYHPEP